MDVANNICKALSWSTINQTKSEKNGIIRLILEKREELIKFLKDVPPSFNIEKFDKHIYCDNLFRLH